MVCPQRKTTIIEVLNIIIEVLNTIIIFRTKGAEIELNKSNIWVKLFSSLILMPTSSFSGHLAGILSAIMSIHFKFNFENSILIRFL
jgi:hypothetical protein